MKTTIFYFFENMEMKIACSAEYVKHWIFESVVDK